MFAMNVQAAEALGAIGLEGNISLLKNSLVVDPAQEVRETCELALRRIEEVKGVACKNGMVEASPFLSVDPAAPACSSSSVGELRFVCELVINTSLYYLCHFSF